MADDLDAIAARAYTGVDDLWIEDACERWVAPHIAGWCKGRVLDLGWGTGTMGKALLAAGVDLTVIEGSVDLIARAGMELAGRYPWKPQFHLSMFEDFDLEGGLIEPFDTVLCLFVLEHVEDPLRLLERAYSWLRPGGRLICAVPSATSVHRRVGYLTTGQPVDTPSERDLLVGHRRVYTADDLMGEVADAGFKVWYPFGWFLKPVWNSLMVGWPPEMIDALCEIGWVGAVQDCANIGVLAHRPDTPSG
jgi:SAM-dependent methyltransferase